ncbi:MAG TPA: MogA/MoaB family molybdenum cofactor biosynthesis protein [Mycobacteriales bacterium]|nr:MogA/MoaB family molybdenum cofactor biosynthesis protein [Mycobacteriales bacterium]
MGAVDGLPPGARAAVITVSDRSHGGLRHDASGPLLATLLGELGFQVSDVVVVPDEVPDIAAAVTAAAAAHDLVVTTGGTGLNPRDVTPEAVLPLLDRAVPGLAEALRAENRSAVPTTILSRAVAGTVGQALVVTLPGSTGGVRDGVTVLAPVVGHAVAQLRGGDH